MTGFRYLFVWLLSPLSNNQQLTNKNLFQIGLNSIGLKGSPGTGILTSSLGNYEWQVVPKNYFVLLCTKIFTRELSPGTALWDVINSFMFMKMSSLYWEAFGSTLPNPFPGAGLLPFPSALWLTFPGEPPPLDGISLFPTRGAISLRAQTPFRLIFWSLTHCQMNDLTTLGPQFPQM